MCITVATITITNATSTPLGSIVRFIALCIRVIRFARLSERMRTRSLRTAIFVRLAGGLYTNNESNGNDRIAAAHFVSTNFS